MTVTPQIPGSVPASHPIGCGTPGQGSALRDSLRDSDGQKYIKILAKQVLNKSRGRDTIWDGNGTAQQTTSAPLDYSQEGFEERAAIIEYQAQIPRKWAEAFARIDLMRKPHSISAEDWQRVVDGTGKLLDGHISVLVQHGWSIADIFGCHPVAPVRRYDVKGLLLLMRENEVIAIINNQSIGLQNPQTGNTLFYRRPLNSSPDRIMLWELP